MSTTETDADTKRPPREYSFDFDRTLRASAKYLFVIMAIPALSGCAQLQMVRGKPLTINYEYDAGSDSRGRLWDRALAYFDHEPHIDIEHRLYYSHQNPGVVRNRKLGLIQARGYAKWHQGDRSCWSEYQITFASRKGHAEMSFRILRRPGYPAECRDWILPDEEGYDVVFEEFQRIADKMVSVLYSPAGRNL